MANKKKKSVNRLNEALKANEKMQRTSSKVQGPLVSKNLSQVNSVQSNSIQNNNSYNSLNDQSLKTQKKPTKNTHYELPIKLIKKDLRKTVIFSLIAISSIFALSYFNISLENLINLKNSFAK